MTSDLDLRGVWVPLITPFDAQGAVDVKAIERLCHDALAAGVTGIVALGTTGEASALEDDEKQLVVTTISQVCASAGARVIVGTGSNNTRHTIEATEALEGIPAVVAALVVVPYYVRPRTDARSKAQPRARQQRPVCPPALRSPRSYGVCCSNRYRR